MGDSPPWLTWMNNHKGEIEWTGTQPTQFVIDCFKATNYGKLEGSTPPSCAATLCRALEESGYLSPHSAAAVDFTRTGLGCTLKPGAIAVFKWKNGDHHVSVCTRVIDEDTAEFLGGNQGHKIQTAIYPRKFIIAVRWPVPIPVKGVA